MGEPVFTVLMPVNRPPDLMRYAVASVQTQTVDNFELLIIGDGAPSETIDAGREAASRDFRIKVHAFPKGRRNGEAHRHAVLQDARGRFVCHLCDDDLWFPEHLEEMGRLLEAVDFGHTLHTYVSAGGVAGMILADLTDPRVHGRMLSDPPRNFFGHTVAGYRIEAYRRLSEGWSPAPVDVPPDLHMWRKFLASDGIRAGTSFSVTSVHFASPERKSWPMSRRREESERYSVMIATKEGRAQLTREAYRQAARDRQSIAEERDRLKGELSWITRKWSYRAYASMKGLLLRRK